jgi:cephalosporin hydroxylase
MEPLKKDGDNSIHRGMVRTTKGDDRIFVPLSGSSTAAKKMVAALKASHPLLENGNFVKISNKELINDLVALENKLLAPHFKFGVLYCKPGQLNEDDLYKNGK